MKIGILTFHRSINYGAFMQCYSLSKRIQSDFPEAIVEVIDYTTETSVKNYKPTVYNMIVKNLFNSSVKMTLRIKAIIAVLISIITDPKKMKYLQIRYKNFVHSQKYLNLSKNNLVSNKLELFDKWINEQEYDIVIVGSDCVWEWKQFGFPNAYFLDNSIKCKKLSYAASSDRIYYNEVSENQLQYLNECFKGYDYIGVRDFSTECLIDRTTKKGKWFHNCDPTTFLDMNELYKISKETVREKLVKLGLDLNKPIIGVMANKQTANMAKKLFGNKYQIVSLYEPHSFFKYNLIDITTLEWATAFSFFALTITNFFHGTMLSLKNGVPTMTFDYWYSMAEDHPTKLRDLYDRLNLSRQHYYTGGDFNENELKQIYDNGINFINNPDTEEIKLALDKQAESYQSFKEALEKLIRR